MHLTTMRKGTKGLYYNNVYTGHTLWYPTQNLGRINDHHVETNLIQVVASVVVICILGDSLDTIQTSVHHGT